MSNDEEICKIKVFDDERVQYTFEPLFEQLIIEIKRLNELLKENVFHLEKKKMTLEELREELREKLKKNWG